ncbi:MAG: ABC transporter permease, partial [Clostridia bacterium]|nr:ABC transporter permease [Clostridia bacterium]
ACVTAVGLMTMAAFIGAGGLGYLVFSGIRTVNNNQILAGAIPACVLALMVDFLLGLVEKLVTPISLQKGDNTIKKRKRTIQRVILAVSAVVIASSFIFTSIGGGNEKKERVISVGSKDFTEQVILGNMVADIIEANTDISVNRKLSLAGTQVAFSAMQKGDIDLYIEYSGTAYTDTLKHSPISDVQEVYNVSKSELKSKYNIETLQQFKFNNTYILAVTQETASKYNLETISDFAKVASNLKSGTTYEFLNRDDGLAGLENKYGFKMGESIALDSSPRYTALVDKEVDVIDAFSTDGLLKKFELKTLEDDKGFFPPYFAMPILRAETLEEYPEIAPLLEKLGNVITNEVMMGLNYKVDELQQPAKSVASQFLKEQGFIK